MERRKDLAKQRLLEKQMNRYQVDKKRAEEMLLLVPPPHMRDEYAEREGENTR